MSVLDMGCGTCVLAILAFMMGASSVTAIDNDEWAYNNSLENVTRNNAASIKVLKGDASILPGLNEKFDLILANINRNVLLDDMEAYADVLKPRGILMLSGFYQSDQTLIMHCAERFSFYESAFLVKNDWMALKLHRDIKS
jgi:ribosomal protein L11 methyltransferase